MLKKLHDLFFYMGLKREDYVNVRGAIAENNHQNVMIYSFIATIGFFILTLCAILKIGNLDTSLVTYGIAFILNALIFVLNRYFGKKYPAIPVVCTYVFMVLVLYAGIMIAVGDPTNLAASYLGFMMGVSALFCVPPIWYSCVVILSDLTLNAMLTPVQTGEVLLSNRENMVIFGLLSIVIATSLMKIKAEKFNSERVTEFLLEKDRLTGIYNRRSYENQLEKISGLTDRYAVAMFDVNGLKRVNDTLGHKAGDEMICGAAECIEAVFGKYGKCYRIGGDEFAAIMSDLTVSQAEVLAEFERTTQAWRGTLVSSLHVSCGIASAADIHKISADELISIADKRMYEAKSEYYRRSGIDRRRQ